MSEYVWTPTTAEKVRPGDAIRGVVREAGDPELTIVLVDRVGPLVVLHCEGQDEGLTFTRTAPLELRVDVDEWLLQEDALHEERLSQERAS